MFELEDEGTYPAHTILKKHLAEFTAANMVPGIKALKHLMDHDHTKQVMDDNDEDTDDGQCNDIFGNFIGN